MGLNLCDCVISRSYKLYLSITLPLSSHVVDSFSLFPVLLFFYLYLQPVL